MAVLNHSMKLKPPHSPLALVLYNVLQYSLFISHTHIYIYIYIYIYRERERERERARERERERVYKEETPTKKNKEITG